MERVDLSSTTMRKSGRRRKGRIISYKRGAASRFLGRKDDALIASFYYSPGSWTPDLLPYVRVEYCSRQWSRYNRCVGGQHLNRQLLFHLPRENLVSTQCSLRLVRRTGLWSTL